MNTPVHDVIGVGFGPANLAIAIAMAENEAAAAAPLDCCFIEKQPGFRWHAGMMLPNTHLQVSFLKDLVTRRDPTSRFSFVNYLHQKQRLDSFINMGTFFPSRLEYNDYLQWAASAFDDRVHYGEEVVAIDPDESAGGVETLTVHSRRSDGTHIRRRARNVIVGIGGQPRIPDVFAPHRDHPRLIHSSCYGSCRERFDGPAPRLAVIGAGQSAAEIFRDLMDRYPDGRVDLICRNSALNPADDSPFVNEIFNPEFTDRMYNAPRPVQRAILDAFAHTNYSVVDLPLIEEIYRRLYEQRVAGSERDAFLPCREIKAVHTAPGKISLNLEDTRNRACRWQEYDGVVLATGFHREGYKALLENLAPWMTDAGVTRDYRLPTTGRCRPGVFLQGCCEGTHGLSDTLLSVLAVRSQEVVEALLSDRKAEAGLRRTGS
jgi:L-ornithine N5-oxygenase